jgi:hypothetical protein
MSKPRLSTEALVYLLEQHSPTALSTLRGRFPDSAAVAGGTVLGGDEEGPPGARRVEAAALVALTRAGLTSAVARVEPDLAALRRALKRAKYLSAGGILFGALLGLLGWQPMTQAIPQEYQAWIGVGVFLFATGLPLFGHLMESKVISRGRDRKDAYAFLCGLTWQVDLLLEQLRLVEEQTADVELEQCVNRSNALAAELLAAERLLFRMS